MGLFSGVKSFITGEKAAQRQQRAAREAAEAARFRPISIDPGAGGIFGARFETDPRGRVTGGRGIVTDTGVARAQEQLAARLPSLLLQRERLDPRILAAGTSLTELGRRAQFPGDVFGAAERELGLFERLRAPGREAQREEVQARLLAQGRLGTTAGGEVEAALERQFEQQRAADQLAALQSARQQQAQQQQFGLQQLGLGTGLLTQQQQLRRGLFGENLQDLLALQQAQLQPLVIGGQLGSAQSAAGANIGAFLQQGRAAAEGQRLSGPGLFAGFAQGAGTALGASLGKKF